MKTSRTVLYLKNCLLSLQFRVGSKKGDASATCDFQRRLLLERRWYIPNLIANASIFSLSTRSAL